MQIKITKAASLIVILSFLGTQTGCIEKIGDRRDLVADGPQDGRDNDDDPGAGDVDFGFKPDPQPDPVDGADPNDEPMDPETQDPSEGFEALVTKEPKPANAKYSKLWGENGELWSPTGRLEDYSYAGYRAGEKQIPDFAVKANVKDFGAKGDGKTDDSAAFLEALKKTNNGAILIPAGTYVLKKVLSLNKSNIVFRGEGQGKTIIYIPTTLNKVLGQKRASNGHEQWSQKGGFFWIGEADYDDADDDGEGDPVLADDLITTVELNADRGDRDLKVESTRDLKVGQWVRLVMREKKTGSLQARMHADLLEGGEGLEGARLIFSNFVSRIESIRGNNVQLERYLPLDVETQWKPALYRFEPRVSDVGVENLTINFGKGTRASNHHEEPGRNAFYVMNAANCWVRNVTIFNADQGIRTSQADFCTFTGITVTAESGRKNKDGFVGHHCLSVTHSGDMLVSNFDIKTHFRHDIDLENMNVHVVYTSGKGIKLDMGNHRSTPYGNLYTNLDVGDPGQAYMTSGDPKRGPHLAAYNTFWNIYGKSSVNLPSPKDLIGARLNFVGVSGAKSRPSGSKDWYVESLAQDQIYPKDLYRAQLYKRLSEQR